MKKKFDYINTLHLEAECCEETESHLIALWNLNRVIVLESPQQNDRVGMKRDEFELSAQLTIASRLSYCY